MSRPMNNESAKKWWECGRHVRQKEPAPSAEVRRKSPEVVRAPPDASSYTAGVARARGRARLLRAAEQASCHVRPRTRRHARSPVRRRCSGPSSRSQQTLAARHRSEQRRLVALWSRRLSGVRRRVHIHKREEPRKTPLSRDRYRDTTV